MQEIFIHYTSVFPSVFFSNFKSYVYPTDSDYSQNTTVRAMKNNA